VDLVLGEVALGQVSFQAFRFSPAGIMQLILYNHSDVTLRMDKGHVSARNSTDTLHRNDKKCTHADVVDVAVSHGPVK
jgi:hypothetical protein